MATLEQVYAQYAKMLGRDVDALTDAEKKQAFLDAILDGQRIEPFATFVDYGDAVMAYYSSGVETLNKLLQRIARECKG